MNAEQEWRRLTIDPAVQVYLAKVVSKVGNPALHGGRILRLI